ncbi:MAG: hypothetical protein HQK83_16760, partial [Fibrobacteria bacterium]|nr:hypothetical protein [Fibrobacteria bacterium]
AYVFALEKKFEAVEAHLKKSIDFAKNGEALYLLTLVSLRKKDKSGAKRYAEMASAVDPNDSKGIMAKIEVMLASRQERQANSLIKKALAKNPKSCDLLITSAKVSWFLSKDDDVRTSSEKVVGLCPEMEMAYFYLGMVAHRFMEKKQAKKYFKLYKKFGGEESLIPKGY